MRKTIVSALAIAAPLMLGGVAPAQSSEAIELTIMDDKFEPAEITVPAGKPFVLKVKNATKVAAELESHDLRIEKIIPAGDIATIRVRAAKPGKHVFFNEFKEEVRGTAIAK